MVDLANGDEGYGNLKVDAGKPGDKAPLTVGNVQVDDRGMVNLEGAADPVKVALYNLQHFDMEKFREETYMKASPSRQAAMRKCLPNKVYTNKDGRYCVVKGYGLATGNPRVVFLEHGSPEASIRVGELTDVTDELKKKYGLTSSTGGA